MGRSRTSKASNAPGSLCAKANRRAPDRRAPATIQSCAKASWSTKSSGPNKCPITATFVACPLTIARAASHPRKPATARSNSPCKGRSPEATRLADTEGPYRVTASKAAALTCTDPANPR